VRLLSTPVDLPRSSGVQLHPTSLPAGRLGPDAYAWVDWLAAAGQSWWQMLPLGPPDRYGSPYKARSAFAAWPGTSSFAAGSGTPPVAGVSGVTWGVTASGLLVPPSPSALTRAGLCRHGAALVFSHFFLLALK